MSGTGFWHLLTEPERGALSARARETTFVPGSTICVEGEPATHLFVLISGWVKVIANTHDGHERVLALRGNGDVVGEIAAEATGFRTASIQAITGVNALIVPHAAFADFLDNRPTAGRAYRRALTQRWSQAASMLLSRSSASGEQRLAVTLLDLADRHGVRDGTTVRIEMPLSQEELASLAGVSRATATRALARWRRRGIIRTGRRDATILDVAALRTIADR
jgi:CRP-like cAMP-binding protein